MAEGRDELVKNNLEQNQTLKNIQGKRLLVMEMGLPELPLRGSPSSGVHSLQQPHYSITSSTDLKRPLQGAPPLSPLSEDMQDPHVTSTTGREFGYSNYPSVELLPEDASRARAGWDQFHPHSTCSGSDTNHGTPRAYTNIVPVESSSACYSARSFPSNPSDPSSNSSQQHFSMASLSPPNDLNAPRSHHPVPDSGAGMMQCSGTPNIMFVPVTLGTQQGTPNGFPCHPYMFPWMFMPPGLSSINPFTLPIFQPSGNNPQVNSQPAATKMEFSSSSNSSSPSLQNESESVSCKPYGLQINNETRLTDLPLPMMNWITRKLDDMNAEKNWQHMADRHGWVYSKIKEHKDNCCRYQKSFFESLLYKDPFTTHTVGHFKEDMKAIQRMDVFLDFDRELQKCLVK